MLSSGAYEQPYRKLISFKTVSKPTLIRVKFDMELYNYTADDYRDIRLKNKYGIEGYVLKSYQSKNIENQKTLTAQSYSRAEGKLTYLFKKPFDVEKIVLNIEDKNFESLVDVFVDGKQLISKHKVFDYSAETGIHNFSIEIPKTKVKELVILYHLDKTTSFYKKYQYLRKMRQYLTVKSATFLNTNKIQKEWDRQTINLMSMETKEKETSYLFQTEYLPFSKLEPLIIQKNFNRKGRLYSSNDGITWHLINQFSLSLSTLNNEKRKNILGSSRAKYIKIVIENEDNKPLSIEKLTLFTMPLYLYFIATPKESYELYFGNKNLFKPKYEIEHLFTRNTDYTVATLSGKFSLPHNNVDVSFFEKYKEIIFIVVVLLSLGIMGYIAFGLLKRV